MQKQSFESETQSSDSGDNESFIEERKELLEELFERIEAYVQLNVQLYKLRTIEFVAESTSTVVSKILIGLVAIMFFMFLNIGIAIWLGNLLGSPSHGYFLLSGFYLLVLVMLFIFRKNMFKKSISEGIMQKFAKD